MPRTISIAESVSRPRRIAVHESGTARFTVISRTSAFFSVTSPPPSRSTTNCSAVMRPRTIDLSVSCTISFDLPAASF